MALLLILGLSVENFATPYNLFNLLGQVAPIGMMACGLTFVLITGGIDISGPAVMTTAAIVGADYMATTGDLVFGPILMILVGAFLGGINGFAVSTLRMVALVVTLSMMTMFSSVNPLSLFTMYLNCQKMTSVPTTMITEIVNWTTTRMFLNFPDPLLVVVLPFSAWIGLNDDSTMAG